MIQPAKAQEPSMEEILASIRRIIADDDSNKAPPKAADPVPAPVAASPPPESPMRQTEIDTMLTQLNAVPPPPAPPAQLPAAAADVLDLTEAMATAAPAAEARPKPGFRTIDEQSDVVFDESAEGPPPRPALASPGRRNGPDNDVLISAATSAAVDSAFNTLAQTVLVQNARTLEDLVREMLRPLLKSWLDDNLPGLVERLVRAEIERVSRGRDAR
jgi:cell pole-organizing protein PopZ